MKINIEVQYLCVDQKYVRGIPYYIINLLRELYAGGKNTYTISFCDYDGERNNRLYINNSVGDFIGNAYIRESNDLDYRWISTALRTRDVSRYAGKPYGDYFGIRADVYHFPTSLCLPQNVEGQMVVTVHDLIPILPSLKHELKASVVEEFVASQNYMKEREAICICPSYATKKDLQEYFDIANENIFVVPQGFSPEKLWIDRNGSCLKDMGIDGPYLLYLGALDPRKGVGDIVNAYELVRKEFDIKLVLAGSGEKWAEKELYPRISNSTWSEDIILPGYVTEEQKRVLLSACELFLFPSEYEGFGIPILEAMACGAPVLTCDVSSMPEVGGDAAMYVPPHFPEKLADSVLNILNDGSLRNEMSRKGLIRCKSFSWKQTAEMTEAVYEEALKRH